MQLQKVVNMFGGDLTRRYGQKVHKLTLHGGFSCPNRDGTIGRGGCTFCNVASFADEAQQHRSIAEQLAHQANLVNRAKRYLAYFQAYTSTFAEVQVLRSMYQQAVSQANIVGLCVGTRPDCVPDAVLDLLCEYKDQGYEVWLELGLQTAHDKTLHRINRGHDFACYQRTTQLARQRGLKVCSHLIVGLPGEGHDGLQVCGAIAEQIVVKVLLALQAVVISIKGDDVDAEHIAHEDAHDGYEVARVERLWQSENEYEEVHAYHGCRGEQAREERYGYGAEAQAGAVGGGERGHEHHDEHPEHVDGGVVPLEKVVEVEADEEQLEHHAHRGCDGGADEPRPEAVEKVERDGQEQQSDGQAQV